MVTNETKVTLTENELAHLGAGKIGYIRKIRSEEITERFPGAPALDPGIDLWALFGADGTPILLSDNRSSAFSKAAEAELHTVSIH